MRMSANENEPVDIHLYTNRRSNSIDLEDINRMERPSRVFSSRHNLMPPAVGGWSHLLLDPVEQAEQFRRQYPYYYETPYTSRIGGSTANGDTTRNRSPFVRFTITDPETQQITAAGQIPLNSPPTTTQANILTSNAELGLASDPLNETSDDEYLGLRIRRYHVDQNRRYLDHFSVVGQTPQQLRNSRSGRRSRRLTEYPYNHPYHHMRSNFDNNPSNSRSHHNRRARFSSTNRGYNDPTPERDQTPEQELPEVLPPDMERERQYHIEDYLTSQDSTSTFSPDSIIIHSDEENSIEDEDVGVRVTLDVPNETPRTRVVPFITSPMSISYSSDADPSDALDIPTATITHNISTGIQFDNIDNNPIPVFRDIESPLLPPFVEYNEPRVSYMSAPTNDVDLRSSVRTTDTVSRTSDADLNTSNNTTNDTVINSLNANEPVDLNVDEINSINLRPTSSPFAPTVQEGDQSGVNEETVTVQHAEEHPESYEELNDQLTRLFECPVCFEHIVPPIFQCLFGHLICNKCVIMCENCPTCRNPFNSKRNLYMEKVGYLIKFPCKNALTGCKQQMFLGQKETHEQECCYRHYQCFFTNCTWKGYYPELHVHMVNSHSSCILNGTDRTFDILLPNHNQTYKWFLLAHNEYFAVIAQISAPPRSIKIQVNLLGPDVKAKQFTFTIKLTQQKSPSDSRQKLIYERTTLPYSDVHDFSNNNVLKKDVFSLTSDMLETFTKRKRRRRLPVNLIVNPVSSL